MTDMLIDGTISKEVYDEKVLGFTRKLHTLSERRHRKCVATGIYVVSDVYAENDWKLGWEGNNIKRAVYDVIDMIIKSIR